VTNLRKGRIENPGYEKLSAIAKAMGFPPEEWFEENLGDGSPMAPTEEGCSLAGGSSTSSMPSGTRVRESHTPTPRSRA
jgi:hypothetical protein